MPQCRMEHHYVNSWLTPTKGEKKNELVALYPERSFYKSSAFPCFPSQGKRGIRRSVDRETRETTSG